MPPAKQQSQPHQPTVLDGVLDRIGTLSVALYAEQQHGRELAAELAQARAEIEALTATNEALSQQLSAQGAGGAHAGNQEED